LGGIPGLRSEILRQAQDGLRGVRLSGFVLSHPWHKDKNVPGMGHPIVAIAREFAQNDSKDWARKVWTDSEAGSDGLLPRGAACDGKGAGFPQGAGRKSVNMQVDTVENWT
jgi:hypothetical protein